jgi:site-specific recombinase XerD
MENTPHIPNGSPETGKTHQSIQKPKLLNMVRNVIRTKHYSIRTEQAYTDWIKRYICFHNKQHPEKLDEKHISEFLTHLAVQKKVTSSTQNQALCAIIFLYKNVLDIPIGELEN